MITLLDGTLTRVGTVQNTLTACRLEEINGENTLDFSAILDTKLSLLITDDTVLELDNDYFDVSVMKKEVSSDNTYLVSIESDHISYRLNDPKYNIEWFAATGTPQQILTQILQGTEFTAGVVDNTTPCTYSAQEAKSRRQLLMEFLKSVGGELKFNKFSIDIKTHRGDTISKPIVKGKNVNVVTRSLNKREKDAAGKPLVVYTCEPLYLPGDNYILGDEVILIHTDLGVNISLRVVRMKTNPYDKYESTFDLGNYSPGIVEESYRIETSAVIKGTTYYGARISPQFGFESIRSDKKARTVMNADKIAMQVGDGSGEVWMDKLYFDPEKGNFVFEGDITIKDITGRKTIVNSYGLDTNFIKSYKNLIRNSQFEVFHSATKIADYWTGGTVSPDSSFFGTVSMKLLPTETCITSGYEINPQWYNSIKMTNTRVSFYRNGGAIRVQVLDELGAPYPLLLSDGTTALVLEAPSQAGWIDSRFSFSFKHGAHTKCAVQITNIGDNPAYIDAVQLEPDYTGMWPSFYTDGPYSTPAVSGTSEVAFNTLLQDIKFYDNGIKAKYEDGSVLTFNITKDVNGKITSLYNVTDSKTITIGWPGGTM